MCSVSNVLADRVFPIEFDGHQWQNSGKNMKVDGHWVKYYYKCGYKDKNGKRPCQAKKHLMHRIVNPTELHVQYSGVHVHPP